MNQKLTPLMKTISWFNYDFIARFVCVGWPSPQTERLHNSRWSRGMCSLQSWYVNSFFIVHLTTTQQSSWKENEHWFIFPCIAVNFHRIKFLAIATEDQIEVYAWAPKPYHKFMAFKVIRVSLGNRLRGVFTSSETWVHANRKSCAVKFCYLWKARDKSSLAKSLVVGFCTWLELTETSLCSDWLDRVGRDLFLTN